MNTNIGIIGLGNMGEAIYNCLRKTFSPKSLFICDNDKNKLDKARPEFATTNANSLIDKVDTIIFAVKPQSFQSLMESLENSLEDKLIISIMAGVSVDKLLKMTGSKKIIRSMPNLPIQVEKGVIGWIATPDVDMNEKGYVRRIFSAFGNDIEVKEESKLDALTALSGSGPAYYYFLCELLESKAMDLGFSREEARVISERTFVGCAALLDGSNRTAKDWRKAVASKGGTTEAAIDYLAKSEVHISFFKAVDEAIKRSKELNQ